MPTPTLTSAQARRLLARFRASGSSQTAFCKRHRVSPSLFSYWLHRLQPPAPVGQPAFREVSLPSASTPSACILTLPGGARLEFPASHLGTALSILSGGKASC
jgi:hypothetical protein